jgi:prepilin-type N-terminal cleavage/methylation domain-containing protein
MRASRGTRGFTVVELLISMTIMGVVLALAIVEFVMVFNHNNLTGSNITADSNARVSMAKVTNELRQATPEITDFNTNWPVIVSPTLGSGASASVEYYRADPGPVGLNGVMPTGQFGNPLPCYDDVKISYDPAAHTLTKTVTPQTNSNCSGSASTSIIAYNIMGFNVQAMAGYNGTPTLFDIDLQTTASSGNYGIYDLNTQVTLGYDTQ